MEVKLLSFYLVKMEHKATLPKGNPDQGYVYNYPDQPLQALSFNSEQEYWLNIIY